MTKISKDQAELLAIAYSEWKRANWYDDDEEICIWGSELLRIQKETGVVMCNPNIIRKLMKVSENIIERQGVNEL